MRRVVVCAVLVLAGCGSDRDYAAAERANTVVAFDDYLRLHPDSAHASEARAHLATLVEAREWERAHSADTADAYQQYLRGYPSGAHAHDALIAIADLNMAAVPNTEASGAASAPSLAPGGPPATPAVKGPIARTPVPAARVNSSPAAKPAPVAAAAPSPARAPTVAAPGTRIQLGAFASESAATAAWQRLAHRYAELAGRTPLVASATLADGRHVHRLQVGGFSAQSAAAMCAALAASHDACLIVPAAAATTN